jgi:hypothetical protein
MQLIFTTCNFFPSFLIQGCNPLFTMYHYEHSEKNGDEDKKLPSCLSQENEAPSCKQDICQCACVSWQKYAIMTQNL